MKCIYCGEEIKEGCIYCSYCGKEAQIVPDYNEFEDDYINGLVGRDGDTRRISPDALAKAEAAKKRKEREELKAKKEQQKIIIIISVIVLVIASIVVIVAISSSIKNSHANSFEYQVGQAEKSLELSDVDAAIEYYENALNLDKDNINVRYSLADIYLSQDNPDAAIIMFQEIIGIDNSQIDSYKNLIEIYETKGDYDSIVALETKTMDSNILALFNEYSVLEPTFSIEGDTYDSEIEVELIADVSPSSIYYTLDGTDPISQGMEYETAIKFDEEGTYTIKAVVKSDKNIYSNVVSSKYIIKFAAPDVPIVVPDGGTLVDGIISVEIPEGCVAYYTWDGTDPNVSSDQYVEGIIAPTGNNVLSVILYNPKTEKFSDVYRERFEYYN